MTEDKAQAFIDAVFARIESGELPTIASFSEDEKQALLCVVKLIKTPEQRKAAAFLLSKIKDDRDVAAFGVVMMAGHFALAMMFVLKHLLTVPGAIVAALIASLVGGVKLADIITILAKAL